MKLRTIIIILIVVPLILQLLQPLAILIWDILHGVQIDFRLPDQKDLYIISKVMQGEDISCTESNGLELCLKNLDRRGPTYGFGKDIGLYREEGTGLCESIVVTASFTISRSAWYRVEDAVNYLKSLGYNVTVDDLRSLTIQIGFIVWRFWDSGRVVEKTLPNGTVARFRVCESSRKPFNEYLLVLGNPRKGSLYAFRMDASSRWERIVAATPVTLAPGKVVKNVSNITCKPLRETLKELFRTNVSESTLNKIIDELKKSGAPDRICYGSVFTVTQLVFKPLNKSVATFTINLGIRNITVDALEIFSANSLIRVYDVEQKDEFKLGAYVTAKVRIWVDTYLQTIWDYQDLSAAGVKPWAPIVYGCCNQNYFRHSARKLNSTHILAHAYAKWTTVRIYSIFPPFGLYYKACTNAGMPIDVKKLLAEADTLKCAGYGTCYCGTIYIAGVPVNDCRCKDVFEKDCEIACGCPPLVCGSCTCIPM
jgi:hypothetical protein